MYAIWGGGDLDHIRQAARHKTIKDAQLYYRDSKALLARARRTGSHILSLPPAWQPIFLENSQAARRIAIDGSCPSNSQALNALASTYVAKYLRVNVKSTALFQLVFLTERDIPKASAFDELQTILADQAPGLAEKINALINEIVYQRLGHRPDTDTASPPAQVSPQSPTNLIEDNRPILPGRRGGTNNVDRRWCCRRRGQRQRKWRFWRKLNP